MGTGALVIAMLFVVVGVFAGWILRAYFRQRGDRLITCPETLTHEAVRVDAGQAALDGLTGQKQLRLSDCTRWPERQSCGQECLSQINAAPDGCLVRSLVTKWYAGRACSICGRPVGDREWMEHQPALLDPQASEPRTLALQDVPPERMLDVLATHEPVCWNCHVAETFRRQRPDLVIDRPTFPTTSDARR